MIFNNFYNLYIFLDIKPKKITDEKYMKPKYGEMGQGGQII